MITKKDVALKILQVGKAGFTTQEDGYKKLDECIALIDKHVTEQLSIQGVSDLLPLELSDRINLAAQIESWEDRRGKIYSVNQLEEMLGELNMIIAKSNNCKSKERNF